MPDEAGLREIADDPGAYCIVDAGEVAGLIQYYEEDEPDYRHAGMDIALRSDHHGRGLGREALVTLARYLIDVRGHHRLVIDPAAANERAIASYRRVGFRPVGIMRRYERGPDGTWHDGLLMDLLAEELAPAP
jgi:aminoglycoside 6'-N-acetyltransferase